MFKYIFLGFVQGVTEFLPISSSGHLVILKQCFDIGGDNLILNVILHLATLLAIVIFFRRDIKNLVKDFSLLKNIVITTIVTGLIVIAGKDFFEKSFTITKAAVLGMGITGIILLSTFRRLNGTRETSSLNIVDAVLVGVFQAIAVIPGISRSGATISAQLWRGVERQTAFRYSFLVAIPAILGAVVMEFPRLEYISDINPLAIGAGFLSAFFTGLITLKLLLLVMQKAKFPLFGYYCLFIALSIFLSGCATVYNPVTGVQEVALVSTASEVSMGRKMAWQVSRKFPISRDPALIYRVREIGGDIARVSDRQDLVYHFSVISGRQINAFTLPGGFIYVYSGLMESVNDDELAIVLAHEVGHVAARHPAKKMEANMGYQLLEGLIFGRSGEGEMRQVMNIFFNIMSAGYERNDELWADKLSLRYTKRAGYDPKAALSFMKKLQAHHRRRGSPAYTLLSSHPPLEERIRNVEAELNKPEEEEYEKKEPLQRKTPVPTVKPPETRPRYGNIKVCPTCHRQYSLSVKYCTRDGTKLE
jgi:undecaprenyl-diphosphatase